jgi:hypothetical protein
MRAAHFTLAPAVSVVLGGKITCAETGELVRTAAVRNEAAAGNASVPGR